MRISTLLPGGSARPGTRRSSPAVALDISADSIVAVQPAGGDRVRRAIVHPLPVGLVVDGEVVDHDGLAVQLRRLFAEHKLPHDVRVGLAHPRLMVRMVELPDSLDGKDLDNAVQHLAGDQLPVGLDQLVVDYRRVGRVPGVVGGGQQRILMAAARKDGLERLMRALEGAGLHIQRLQLSGLAMLEALDHPLVGDDAVLFVQAGALTNVVITEDGQPLLVRAASAGSESIAAGLAERVAITHEAARTHVSTLGLGSAPQHGSPPPIPDELEATVTQQVREGLRRVVAEIQSSRGVYAARPDACPIGAVVLTGTMMTWPGVAAAIEQELNLPVLAAGRSASPDLAGFGIAPERLDVAVGLAQIADDERPDLRPVRHRVKASESAPVGRIAQVSCAMLALIAAAVVYLVVVSNQVSSGRERLDQVTAQIVDAEREAAALKPYDDFAKATVTRRDAVSSVAKSRFNWDRTLTELAEVAPGGVWLTSAKGTLTPDTQIPGGAGDGATTGLRGALVAPALELAGCALRERAVPAYMDGLHAMTGVTEVGFSRSERLEKSKVDSAGNDCRGNDPRAARFALVTYFKTTPAQAAAVQAASSPAARATAPRAQAANGSTAPTNQTAAVNPGGRP